MKSKLLICLIFSSFFISCATSPTGRRQVALLPDSQLNELGTQSFEEMKSKMSISRDQNLIRYIHCIAKPIVEELEENNDYKDWEVVVFNEDSANAFALPGNKIGVHTGIIKLAPSANHLAAVIGHEVGHVLARHSNERVSQQVLAQEGLRAIGGRTSPVVAAGLGLGVQFGVLMPYSRSHETEADEIGQNLMAQAGFNPEAAIEFWQIMEKQGGGAPPEILSTHPSSSSRISNLKGNLKTAKKLQSKAIAAGKTPSCKL